MKRNSKRRVEYGKQGQRQDPLGALSRTFRRPSKTMALIQKVCRDKSGDWRRGRLLGGCEGIQALITDGDRISSFHQPPPNPQQIIDKGMLHLLLSAHVSVKQECVLSTKACQAPPCHDPTAPLPHTPLSQSLFIVRHVLPLTGGIIEKKEPCGIRLI